MIESTFLFSYRNFFLDKGNVVELDRLGKIVVIARWPNGVWFAFGPAHCKNKRFEIASGEKINNS
jgi:hypothetical protein